MAHLFCALCPVMHVRSTGSVPWLEPCFHVLWRLVKEYVTSILLLRPYLFTNLENDHAWTHARTAGECIKMYAVFVI